MGRRMDQASDVSVRPNGPWQIAVRLYEEGARHHISVLAAAISYNVFFAIFPTLASAISLYGLVADAGRAERHLDLVSGVLPLEVISLLREQLVALTSTSETALSLSFIASLAIALYSSTRGVQTLIDGLNMVHEAEDGRSFVKRLLLALALTLGAILFTLVTVTIIALAPVILGFLGLDRMAEELIAAARWPILAGLVLLSLSVIYRFGPCRENPRWRWISWGAALATATWLVGSGGFAFYAVRFGSYNETYGSMGAVMVVLIWLYLTGYIVLLGAQIDAILEERSVRVAHQEGADTSEFALPVRPARRAQSGQGR